MKPNPLLNIIEGQTEEEAITEWWLRNGLDHEAARRGRAETYRRQKEETNHVMENLKKGNVEECKNQP